MASKRCQMLADILESYFVTLIKLSRLCYLVREKKGIQLLLQSELN